MVHLLERKLPRPALFHTLYVPIRNKQGHRRYLLRNPLISNAWKKRDQKVPTIGTQYQYVDAPFCLSRCERKDPLRSIRGKMLQLAARDHRKKIRTGPRP